MTGLDMETGIDMGAPAPLDATALLRELKSWSEQGWLRHLDQSFAAFLHELDADAPVPLLLAAALLAHLEGRGHSCLALEELISGADALLGWAPAPMARLRTMLDGQPRQPQAWLALLRASPLVALDDGSEEVASADGPPPLVLRGGKLFLRRYWRHERQVAAQVLQRCANPAPVDEAGARLWLDRLFPPATEPAAEPAGVDWQKLACAVALRARYAVITGGPGTGKTYTAARLLALLFATDAAPQRLRVALAAPTGKAAARLKQSISDALQELQPRLADSLELGELVTRIGPARTLHSLLGARPGTRKFQADAAHPLELDVLIVDEASMIHLEMMSALLAALPAQARLILLGDKDQLASVEAGAVLGELCRGAEFGRYRPDTAAYALAVAGQVLPPEMVSGGPALAQQTVMLRTSRRFGGPIGQLALAVNAGDLSAASALLKAAPGGAVEWIELSNAGPVVPLAVLGRHGAEGGYGAYLALLQQRPMAPGVEEFEAWVMTVLTAFERFRLLCAVHEGPWGTVALNAAIERALDARGLLKKRGEWYAGRPVMVTRNDHGVGVFNGDIGIVLAPVSASGALRAWFLDGKNVRSVGVSRLAHVETAFALTVHKSQGSEFEHTVLVLPQEPSRVLARELVYTGITRARSAFTLVSGRRAAFADALARRTRRSSGLLELLDPEGEST